MSLALGFEVVKGGIIKIFYFILTSICPSDRNMAWFRLIGFFVIVLGYPFLGFGQAEFQKSIKLSYERGPMLSNGTDWGDQIKDGFQYHAVDVQLGWKKFENTPYNHLYRYPIFGFGINSTLNYSSEIGRPQAIYGFMDIPFSISGQNRKISFGYFTQLGLGFNLKPFDELENPDNQYIGSKVNCYVNVGLNSTIKLSERMDVKTSFGFKHFSNGSTKRPNAGINLFPVNLGVHVKLGELIPIPQEKPLIPEKALKSFWNLALYTGIKNYEVGEETYFRGGLGINYLIEPKYKYRFGLGFDMFWAQGMESRNPGETFSIRDQTSLAIVGSWEWQVTEKLYVPIGLGAYLYRNELNQEITWFYERIGARYRFDNNMFAGMQIKAHKAKADFFEFTVGYTIPSK
ncbi:acyloxyacyl hydrolase [Algoriphagus sp. AK58]|uniref:acyloxyacyl hydrolase n=1 Tax=Algoriphagus sp. AK58 TaxID=1406877 RepID=UPI00164FE84E|nr:acyloxyacyl hydrolase [Algoriphagus sp. AK58]MBC6367891.1 hypothetical protein [Algoriphagus sp. AK58]